MLTFHGRFGHRIVRGIPEEIVKRLQEAGGTCGHVRDTIGVAYSVTPTDPYRLALLLQEMLAEASVNAILESSFLEAELAGQRISGIRGIHPGGFFRCEGSQFIDASGDGALAAACGCASDRGREGLNMPATLIFSLDHVDLKQVCSYMEENPREFHDETHFEHLRESQSLGVSGFFTLWKEGKVSVPRDRLLFYQTGLPDEVSVNSTRITDFDPLDPQNLRRAYLSAYHQVFEIHDFLRRMIPGFGSSRISRIAPFLGVREVRRVRGLYMLTGEDVVRGRRFPDEIAFGGFPVDIHLPGAGGLETENLGGRGFYGIPYRCLIPGEPHNLLVTGKCISAEFEAHASTRVQATTMSLGQAAGVAAALAAKAGIDPQNLEPDRVRSGIFELGAIPEPGEIEDIPW